MISEVLLRRRSSIVMDAGRLAADQERPEEVDALLYSAIRNVESLGYAFAPDVLRRLMTYDQEQMVSFYFELIPVLKQLRGADVEYRPMYRNFPEEVASKDEAELYVNALIHYLTDGIWMPDSEHKERLPLYESTKLQEIRLGRENALAEIARNLLGGGTSLSEQDKKDIRTIFPEYGLEAVLPEKIPMKETLVFITAAAMECAPDQVQAMLPHYKTATDILRLAAGMSGGDISLAQKCRFISFKRAQRRLLMDLLAGVREPLEDMFRYRESWLRLGERLHPGEFRDARYEKVRASFHVLRNEAKPLYYHGIVESHMANGRIEEAAALLQKRPGEFVRRLDQLLRQSDGKAAETVLTLFDQVADRVSVPVLLHAMKHFETREDPVPIRVFFPKGKLAKAMSVPNALPPMDRQIADRAADLCRQGIIRQLRNREPLGSVYVSDAMKQYIVPFSQRSASSGKHILVRGSTVPVAPEAGTIRGFIYWTNMKKTEKGVDPRVDLDLSASIYDENWRYVSHVSYTHLKDRTLEAYHSGDIVNGGPANGKGVAEFIDISIDAIRKKGRYVVFQVYSFTRQHFKDIPNARFGWMTRKHPKSGEIFEPRTVDQLYDLTTDAAIIIPVIFDCLDRTFIWCDMIKTDRDGYWGNNLESNLQGTTAVCYAMTHLRKPTLWDLIMLHIEARGCLEPDRDKADLIFEEEPEETSEEKPVVITPFDIDYFIGKML